MGGLEKRGEDIEHNGNGESQTYTRTYMKKNLYKTILARSRSGAQNIIGHDRMRRCRNGTRQHTLKPVLSPIGTTNPTDFSNETCTLSESYDLFRYTFDLSFLKSQDLRTLVRPEHLLF